MLTHETGVRQEPCAAFVLITLARQFSNRCDDDINGGGDEDLPAMRANFRNGLRLVGKEIEALFLKQAETVRQSVTRIMTGLSRCVQRERPGRQGKSVLPRVTFRGISVVPPVLSVAIQGTPDARTARSTPWIEDSWLDGFSRHAANRIMPRSRPRDLIFLSFLPPLSA